MSHLDREHSVRAPLVYSLFDNFISFLVIMIRPKSTSHIDSHFPIISKKFSRCPRDFSSIIISCNQAYAISCSLVTSRCCSIGLYRSSDSIYWTAVTSVSEKCYSFSQAIIVSGGSVLTALSIFFGTLTCFFEKFVTIVRNGTCFVTSLIPCADISLLVGWFVWIRSKVKRSLVV